MCNVFLLLCMPSHCAVSLFLFFSASTICQMCNDFDTENYGYLAHDECYKYYLCRHDVTSGSVDLFATMKCGPGTVFNSASAKEGKPCVAVSEENPNCPRENDVIPPYGELLRSYYQHVTLKGIPPGRARENDVIPPYGELLRSYYQHIT